MTRYHAHIYFNPVDQVVAENLWQRMREELTSEEIKVGPLELALRGPHLLPQFEMDFPEDRADEMISWLRKNRQNLSVLVHPEIEDEMRSHLEDVLWIGIPLPLNFSKLDLRSRGRDFQPLGQKPTELLF